jgi:hypothetical protein
MLPAAMRAPAILLALVLTLEACGSESRATGGCPGGAIEIPARTASILARLSSVPAGASLVQAAGGRVRVFCFAERGPNAIDDTAAIVLDPALAEADAAARVGHLLLHLRDGSPYPAPADADADCDSIVDRALDREAAAHAVELELRRALAAAPGVLRFDFEEAFWAAPGPERLALVRRALATGAAGPGRLAIEYRARCEHERTSSR